MMNVLADCSWIGADEACSSPVIKRSFSLDHFSRAELTITGLGYFEATVNGHPVTDARLIPVVSDYEPRNLSAFLYPLQDTPHNRIYVYTFPITDLLVAGTNTLEIRLGNGFYRQTERCCEGSISFGKVLKTAYAITAETSDGTIRLVSDGSERWQESEIRFNNLFLGEMIDFTHPIQPEAPVVILPCPAAELSPAIGTPDRLIRTLQPVLLGEKNGKKIYDAGENISGVVRITTTAKAGSRTRLTFAEECTPALDLDYISTGSSYTCASGMPQIQTDEFVTDGKPRVFMPRFVWHAFRYFDVEGPFDALEVCVIHSDTPLTASFESSMEGPQFLYDSFVRTQLNNMHGSYPSDCPHRERLGYTGDGQVCAPAALMFLESRAFYEKWIQDILDSQDPLSGHVQHTAPLMGGGGGPGAWGAAIINVPWAYYRQYGDIRMLRKCFVPMLRWIEYLVSRSEDGLIVREEKDGWCLGDWCTLEPIEISACYVNSCCFVKMLRTTEEVARLLGETASLPRLETIREETQNAIRRTFYHEQDGWYDCGRQGADAYAVWCGLEGKEKADHIARYYDKLGHFDTGFVCTDILLEVLFAYDHADTALRLLQSREPGSFLYMKDHGATTIWENWNGEESHNHPMFGAGARQLFEGILGIRQREGTAGYRDVIISPCTLPPGEKVCGSLLTPQGRLTVALDASCGKQKVRIDAPSGIKVTPLLG